MKQGLPQANTFSACQRCSRPSFVSRQMQSADAISASIVGTISTPISFICAMYFG